jgi:L-malate glycosyltransferase
MIQLIHRLRSHEFDERAKRLVHSSPQRIELDLQKKSHPLHIVYVLTHVSVCGGVKVILQHANGLKKMGVKVTLISHFPRPDWYPIETDYISVPFGIELTRAIPLCDVIVATYWDHIHACIETGIAPVVYFEQGDFHLFDKIESIQLMSVIKRQFQLPPHIITISRQVKEIIKTRYGRDSLVFPNAIDNEIFYPKKEKSSKNYMMIVGSDKSQFKGIADLLKAFELVKKKGHDIELLWLTPSAPESSIGQIFVNPPQAQIGELYRKASIYVCGSYYEAFSLPCLEAMACGTPVITTRTPGVMEYARDEDNCLMVEPGDIEGIANKIIHLLSNQLEYEHFQKTGLETANQYKWSNILNDILQFYKQVAQYKVTPKYSLDDWTLFLDDKTFECPEALEKLKQLLTQTEANEVYGSVDYRMIPNIPFFKWEILARRKNIVNEVNIEKVLLKIQRNRDPDVSVSVIAEHFQSGNYTAAISKASELLTESKADSLEQGVYTRWVIHCLIELKQYTLAQSLLSKALLSHPYYTDLYYLQVALAQLTDADGQTYGLMNLIELLKESVQYPEYLNLVEITKKLK